MTFLGPRVRAIKRSVHVYELLSKLGIDYGYSFTHQIICPFHDDIRPSARVYHETDSIHCWTCGQSWDVIGIVKQAKGFSFFDALDWLERNFEILAVSVTNADEAEEKMRSLSSSALSLHSLQVLCRKAADEFIKFYKWRVNLFPDVWSVVCVCWDFYDYPCLFSYDDCVSWLKQSKNFVKYRYDLEFSLVRFDKDDNLGKNCMEIAEQVNICNLRDFKKGTGKGIRGFDNVGLKERGKVIL